GGDTRDATGDRGRHHRRAERRSPHPHAYRAPGARRSAARREGRIRRIAHHARTERGDRRGRGPRAHHGAGGVTHLPRARRARSDPAVTTTAPAAVTDDTSRLGVAATLAAIVGLSMGSTL